MEKKIKKVNNMEKKIRTLMDKCMPLKSVRLSSRDPVWMTALVKSMLRAKSRISCNNVERHKVINSRISEVIGANRKNPRLVIGIGNGGKMWTWFPSVVILPMSISIRTR